MRLVLFTTKVSKLVFVHLYKNHGLFESSMSIIDHFSLTGKISMPRGILEGNTWGLKECPHSFL